MTRKRNLPEAAVLAVCIMIGIYGLGHIVRPVDTDGAYFQIETLHSLPENSVEVMIYGSSHAFDGICPMEMYRQYGIGAYNYGWKWQGINTTKLFLQDSLMVQKPKVALVECYKVNKVVHDTDITAEVYYSRYIKEREAKRKYYKQCLGESPDLERRLSYIMPFAMFHENWDSLTQESFKKLVPGASEEYLKNMGFSPSDEVTEVRLRKYKRSKQKELEEQAISELDEIVQICRENDIELIFYITPWGGNYAYNDAMATYAEENGCVFLDLFKDYKKVGINRKTDFKDKGHLNTAGACKIADYIGKYLADNYDLTDFRRIENNIWEQALDIP